MQHLDTRLILIGFVFLGAAASHPALAADAAPPNFPPKPMSIFAYPGKACPHGSIEYKGPEAQDAVQDSAVYCVIEKRITVLPKSIYKTCPNNLQAYTEGQYTPPADVIWCLNFPPKAAEAQPQTSKVTTTDKGIFITGDKP